MEDDRERIDMETDWQPVDTPETPVIAADAYEEEETPPRRQSAPPRHLLLTVQLAACVLLGVAAFALKSIGGEVWETVRGWYVEQINDSAIFEGARGMEQLWGAATPDEA